MVLLGRLGETKQTVELGNDVGIDLNLRRKLLRGSDEFAEESFLKYLNLLVGSQDAFFGLFGL